MDTPNTVYASFFQRFLAFAIDWILITMVMSILRNSLAIMFLPDTYTSSVLFFTCYFLLTSCYNVLFVYKYGGTLGKRFLSMEIKKEEGKMSLITTIRREIVLKPLSIVFFGLGVIPLFFNKKKQTLYDNRLGLVVVVKSPISIYKKIVAAIIGFMYIWYLLSLFKVSSTLVNYGQEEDKETVIEFIKQKREILIVSKQATEPEFVKFGRSALQTIDNKQKELCNKQLIKVLLQRKECQLEDLDMSSLTQINSLYDIYVKGFVDIQSKLQNGMPQYYSE